MGFDHEALRAYYHKWYRPDLQGIIIIGDIDVDEVENHLKTIFADIPAPVNPAERTRFEVADNVEPIVSICTDREETNYNIAVYYKHDVVPNEAKNDIGYWLKGYIDALVGTMYNNRLEELTQKANPPFIFGYGYYGTFFVSDTKDAWTSPTELKEATTITNMTALSDDPQAYLIRNDGFQNEYYIVENRQQKEWDSHIPGNGITVFHVDFVPDLWVSVEDYVNKPSRQHYLIFPANNTSSTSSIFSEYWAYPYQDNDSLTNTSTPAAILWNANTDGTKLMNKSVHDIDVTNGLASFRFTVDTPTGIEEHTSQQSAEILYDLGPISIIRYSNGTIKKVMKHKNK